MDDDQPHERSQCGAKSRQGTPCKRAPVRGRRRCRLHGGATPWGPASPHWRTGRHSRVLSRLGLGRAYQRAINDPEMVNLREEIAVVDARVLLLLESLATAGAGDDRTWAKIYEAIELRRRLTETQSRLLERLDGTLTGDQVIAFVAVLAGLVKEYVPDPAALKALLGEMEAILDRGTVH